MIMVLNIVIIIAYVLYQKELIDPVTCNYLWVAGPICMMLAAMIGLVSNIDPIEALLFKYLKNGLSM